MPQIIKQYDVTEFRHVNTGGMADWPFVVDEDEEVEIGGDTAGNIALGDGFVSKAHPCSDGSLIGGHILVELIGTSTGTTDLTITVNAYGVPDPIEYNARWNVLASVLGAPASDVLIQSKPDLAVSASSPEMSYLVTTDRTSWQAGVFTGGITSSDNAAFPVLPHWVTFKLDLGSGTVDAGDSFTLSLFRVTVVG